MGFVLCVCPNSTGSLSKGLQPLQKKKKKCWEGSLQVDSSTWRVSAPFTKIDNGSGDYSPLHFCFYPMVQQPSAIGAMPMFPLLQEGLW